jgi:hypothetical protein
MTRRDERAEEEEPAVKSEEEARAQRPRRPRTRVISEAVVAAIPAGDGAAARDTDDEAGAGA